MSIQFGQISFTAPRTINDFVPARRAGIISILVDNSNSPLRFFRPIEFLESDNMEEVNLKTHPNFIRWLEEANYKLDNIFVTMTERPIIWRKERIGIIIYFNNHLLNKEIREDEIIELSDY